jgi:ABC-type phosphate/phosphonate transport system substrate-binding protein
MTQFRTLQSGGDDQRNVAEVVRGIMEGRTNNTGAITLAAAGATSTTITDTRIGYNSVILLSPITANAAALLTSVYVSAKAQGSATLTHSANVLTNRTFQYIIVG